jgi:hypothetical protein
MTKAMHLVQKDRKVRRQNNGKLVTESKRIFEQHKINDNQAWQKAWSWLTW